MYSEAESAKHTKSKRVPVTGIAGARAKLKFHHECRTLDEVGCINSFN
jgi:hypothetical protein